MAHRWEPSTKDCRVLSIEDEYFLGEDLAQALQSLGFHVIASLQTRRRHVGPARQFRCRRGRYQPERMLSLSGRRRTHACRKALHFYDWLRYREHPRPLSACEAMGEALRS